MRYLYVCPLAHVIHLTAADAELVVVNGCGCYLWSRVGTLQGYCVEPVKPLSERLEAVYRLGGERAVRAAMGVSAIHDREGH